MLYQVSLHREPPEVGLVEKYPEVCISGWSCLCHPYIESATALSDKSQQTTVFSGHQKLTSAMKTKVKKVMVDFKFDYLYR